ncbi:MAG TPA: class A beta-lactamase-related serine hydrolase [Gammaproteobacteria bacterium]|nr:class A beta-lactamase-related serine hydrolase [Gammaproteobacteria bacterium]
MKKQIMAGFFIICFLNYSVSHAAEPEPPEDIAIGNFPAVVAYLNKYISYVIDDEDLAGLNIAIVNNQNLVWEKGFGYADVENEIPATVETRYQTGAVTGILTAALVMQLVDAGKISLDENIQTYIPDLNLKSHFKKTSSITVRQLLSHHAGLPLNLFKNSWSESPPSFHSLVDSKTAIHASYPPGLIYAYSNIGYSLLGIIVERVTGLSFAQAMQKYIFQPVGMSQSTIENKHSQDKLAVGYKDDKAGKRLLPRDTPAVGLVSTAKDLSRFVRRYFNKVINKNGLAETIRVQNQQVQLDIEKQVGFTWYLGGLNIKKAGPVIWRGGVTPYHRSIVAMLPQHKLGVVILSNDSRSWDEINKLAEKSLQLMLQAKTGIKTDKPDEDSERPPQKIVNHPNILKDTFASAYTGFSGYIKLTEEGDSYSASVMGWTLSLHKDTENKNWFNLEYDLLGFIPIDLSWLAGVKVRPAVVNQRRVLIVYYKQHQYLFAVQYKPDKIHQGWLSMPGEYQVSNSDALLESMKIKNGELLIKNNQLFFNYEFPVWYGLSLTLPVKTISDNEAIIPGLGTGLNESVSIKEVNGQRFIEYSGYLLKKQNKTEDFLNFDF